MSNKIDFAVVTKEKESLLFHSDAVKKQHDDGKKTAYERIELLLDEHSFVEMYAMLSKCSGPAGVVTGYGTIDSRPVYVFAQDYTVNGGAINQAQATKITKLLKTALSTGAPVVAILDSAGVALDEGVKAMEAYAQIYAALSELSGICPTLSVVAGACFGGAAIIAQLCDISIGIKGISQLSMYGPQVVSALYHKEVSLDALAGTAAANAQGAYALVADNEEDALYFAKKALSLLPDCNADYALYEETADLNKQISLPENASAHEILLQLSDEAAPLVLHADYEPAVLTSLTRVGGHAVALILTDAQHNEGLLTEGALNKAARFVSFADSFNLPIVSVLHTKGLDIPDVQQQIGLVKAQGRLIYNYTSASVPKIALITGAVYGQAYVAMASKSNSDMVFALPEAVLSALAPEAAIQLVWQNRIKESRLPVAEAKEAIAADYVAEKASSIVAAKCGLLDDIVEPAYARMHIVSALEMLAAKSVSGFSKKQGNLPF